MFYILITNPEYSDVMMQYTRGELDEIVGDYNATQLENGFPVFFNGSIHVNAMKAASDRADEFLILGE